MANFSTTLKGLALIGALGMAGSALAQDAGLYGDVADPNAAHVRILAPNETSAVVDGTTVSDLEGGLTPYVSVDPGLIAVSAGEQSGEVQAEAGGYFTLAWDAQGKPVTFTDTAADDPSKAALYLYNLSDVASVDVFVPAAEANALEGVAAGEANSAMLKAPLTFDVELKSGADVVAAVPAISLERKGGVTVVLSGEGGSYTATAVDNSVL